MNDAIDSNLQRHQRLQFSLRTALLLVVLCAAAASLWVSFRQSRENLRLRQEIGRLRNEVGELTIEPGDEQKVHAIAVPEFEARTWRWRVYIPAAPQSASGAAGRQFGMQMKTAHDNGSGSTWHALSSGEHTIVIALRRDLNNRLEWVVRDAQGSATGETRQSASANVEKLIGGSYSGSTSDIGHSTQSVEPGKDLQLLKFEMTGSNSTESVTLTIHEGPPAN